jgi:hypothetical protein
VKNIFRASCLTIFFIGLLIFCLAQNSNQTDVSNLDDEIESAQPCVVKVIQSSISQDGSKKIIGQSTIYSKANGEYRHIAYGPNGPKGDGLLSKHSNELNIYAGLPDGVYRKEAGSNALTYSSPPTDEKMLEFFRSHKSLRNHRDFVRTDKVAGLKVYVLRTEMNDLASPIEWAEDSYSPKAGFGSLRSIVHFRDGSELRTEAVNVEFKEVSEDLNDDLKNLPIKNIEDKIRKQQQE